MRFIPKANTLRKGILLYRGIRYRKGYGVHSPFVYNLITKVIENSCSYYSFNDIELVRKQLLFREDLISYPDRQQKGKLRCRTTGEIVRREAIKPKHGALLFRLTNYFKSQTILQLGPSMGISTLYLTAYATGLTCIALESIPEFAPIAGITFGKAARNPIDLRVGEYKELLPSALKELGKVDFIFFNMIYEQSNSFFSLFESCLAYIHEDTVFVIEGIRANRKKHKCWQDICAHPEAVVTIDLYSIGIVFFNKRLHKRNYIVYF